MWINCWEREWISKLVDEYLSMPVMSSWTSTAKQSKAALKGPKWLHSDSMILWVIIFATDLNKIHFSFQPEEKSDQKSGLCHTSGVSLTHQCLRADTGLVLELVSRSYFCHRGYCMYAGVTEDMLILNICLSYFFSQLLFPFYFFPTNSDLFGLG